MIANVCWLETDKKGTNKVFSDGNGLCVEYLVM